MKQLPILKEGVSEFEKGTIVKMAKERIDKVPKGLKHFLKGGKIDKRM
jgi:hypothetical protein